MNNNIWGKQNVFSIDVVLNCSKVEKTINTKLNYTLCV